MSDNSKKYILDLLQTPMTRKVKTILEDLFFTLETSENKEISYEFVLIDDINKECPSGSKIIFFGKLKDKKPFFEKGGVAVLAEDVFDSEVELTYLKRLLGENSTLDVADSLQTELQALGKVKVTDHLNSGYYCDSIVVKAAEEGFNFLNIKKGVFNLFGFISEIILDDKGEFPIDVEYGFSGNSFFIQSHFLVEEFYSDLLWELLSDESSSLALMVDSAKTIDIYTLEKTQKLVVTASWAKEYTQNKSLYIHSIDSFRPANRKTKLDKVKPLTIDYKKDHELHLPKNKKTPLSLSSISRIVNFLKNQKIDLNKITISNLTDYLGEYPNQSLISKLGTSEKEDILNMIKDSTIQSEISSTVENEKKSLSDDLLDNFLTKIQGLNLDEANEIVSLGVEDYTETSQRVTGWMDEVDQSVQIVKGSQVDIGEDALLIKGSKVDLEEDSIFVEGQKEDIGTNNQRLEVKSLGGDFISGGELPKWRSVKSHIVSGLRKKISNKEISSYEDLEDQFSSLLQDQMRISEKESKALTVGILNESAIESFEKRAVLEDRDESEKQLRLKDAIAKKDIQISRMMKLIDAMKRELLITSPRIEDSDRLKNDVEVKRLKSEIENKNMQIEVLNKNVEILNSKQQTKQLNNDSTGMLSAVPEDSIEIKSYEARIKTLETILKEAKDRSELLSDKLEKQKEEFMVRSDNETIHFREKMMKSQKVINTYQKENKELLLEIEKLKAVQNELSEVATESVQNDNTHLIDEKAKEVETLSLELKKEADQSKGLSLRIKQLEQKNKFLLAQIDENNRSKNKNKANGKSQGSAKLQHKVKHLEKLSSNFKAEAESAKLELAEKKKEIHKLKLESNLLKSKVTEIERKLSINKKNAA